MTLVTHEDHNTEYLSMLSMETSSITKKTIDGGIKNQTTTSLNIVKKLIESTGTGCSRALISSNLANSSMKQKQVLTRSNMDWISKMNKGLSYCIIELKTKLLRRYKDANRIIRFTIEPSTTGCPNRVSISTSKHPIQNYKVIYADWYLKNDESNQFIDIVDSSILSYVKIQLHGTNDGSTTHRISKFMITLEVEAQDLSQEIDDLEMDQTLIDGDFERDSFEDSDRIGSFHGSKSLNRSLERRSSTRSMERSLDTKGSIRNRNSFSPDIISHGSMERNSNEGSMGRSIDRSIGHSAALSQSNSRVHSPRHSAIRSVTGSRSNSRPASPFSIQNLNGDAKIQDNFSYHDNSTIGTKSIHDFESVHETRTNNDNKSLKSNRSVQDIRNQNDMNSNYDEKNKGEIRSINDIRSESRSINDINSEKRSNYDDKSVSERRSVYNDKSIQDNKSVSSKISNYGSKSINDNKSVHDTKSINDNSSLHSIHDNKNVDEISSVQEDRESKDNSSEQRSIHERENDIADHVSLHSQKSAKSIVSQHSQKSAKSNVSHHSHLSHKSQVSLRSQKSNITTQSNRSHFSTNSKLSKLSQLLNSQPDVEYIESIAQNNLNGYTLLEGKHNLDENANELAGEEVQADQSKDIKQTEPTDVTEPIEQLAYNDSSSEENNEDSSKEEIEIREVEIDYEAKISNPQGEEDNSNIYNQNVPIEQNIELEPLDDKTSYLDNIERWESKSIHEDYSEEFKDQNEPESFISNKEINENRGNTSENEIKKIEIPKDKLVSKKSGAASSRTSTLVSRQTNKSLGLSQEHASILGKTLHLKKRGYPQIFLSHEHNVLSSFLLERFVLKTLSEGTFSSFLTEKARNIIYEDIQIHSTKDNIVQSSEIKVNASNINGQSSDVLPKTTKLENKESSQISNNPPQNLDVKAVALQHILMNRKLREIESNEIGKLHLSLNESSASVDILQVINQSTIPHSTGKKNRKRDKRVNQNIAIEIFSTNKESENTTQEKEKTFQLTIKNQQSPNNKLSHLVKNPNSSGIIDDEHQPPKMFSPNEKINQSETNKFGSFNVRIPQYGDEEEDIIISNENNDRKSVLEQMKEKLREQKELQQRLYSLQQQNKNPNRLTLDDITQKLIDKFSSKVASAPKDVPSSQLERPAPLRAAPDAPNNRPPFIRDESQNNKREEPRHKENNTSYKDSPPFIESDSPKQVQKLNGVQSLRAPSPTNPQPELKSLEQNDTTSEDVSIITSASKLTSKERSDRKISPNRKTKSSIQKNRKDSPNRKESPKKKSRFSQLYSEAITSPTTSDLIQDQSKNNDSTNDSIDNSFVEIIVEETEPIEISINNQDNSKFENHTESEHHKLFEQELLQDRDDVNDDIQNQQIVVDSTPNLIPPRQHSPPQRKTPVTIDSIPKEIQSSNDDVESIKSIKSERSVKSKISIQSSINEPQNVSLSSARSVSSKKSIESSLHNEEEAEYQPIPNSARSNVSAISSVSSVSSKTSLSSTSTVSKRSIIKATIDDNQSLKSEKSSTTTKSNKSIKINENNQDEEDISPRSFKSQKSEVSARSQKSESQSSQFLINDDNSKSIQSSNLETKTNEFSQIIQNNIKSPEKSTPEEVSINTDSIDNSTQEENLDISIQEYPEEVPNYIHSNLTRFGGKGGDPSTSCSDLSSIIQDGDDSNARDITPIKDDVSESSIRDDATEDSIHEQSHTKPQDIPPLRTDLVKAPFIKSDFVPPFLIGASFITNQPIIDEKPSEAQNVSDFNNSNESQENNEEKSSPIIPNIPKEFLDVISEEAVSPQENEPELSIDEIQANELKEHISELVQLIDTDDNDLKQEIVQNENVEYFENAESRNVEAIETEYFENAENTENTKTKEIIETENTETKEIIEVQNNTEIEAQVPKRKFIIPEPEPEREPQHYYTSEAIERSKNVKKTIINAMLKGTHIKKYNKNKKASNRIMKLDKDKKVLILSHTGLLKRTKKLPISDIKWIVYGPHTKIFKKGGALKFPWRCFSLVTKSRTIDFESDNDIDADVWILGIQSLITDSIVLNRRLLHSKTGLIFKRVFFRLQSKKNNTAFKDIVINAVNLSHSSLNSSRSSLSLSSTSAPLALQTSLEFSDLNSEIALSPNNASSSLPLSPISQTPQNEINTENHSENQSEDVHNEILNDLKDTEVSTS